MFKITFRRHDGKVNCAELARISAGGGGHTQAAGGYIMTKDWEEFKKRVINYLTRV